MDKGTGFCIAPGGSLGHPCHVGATQTKPVFGDLRVARIHRRENPETGSGERNCKGTTHWGVQRQWSRVAPSFVLALVCQPYACAVASQH